MFFQSGLGNVIIKKCGNFFRICVFKSGVPFEGENATRKNSIPEEKNGLERKRNENIMRAKRVVWELALCNRWNFFATCTLDAKKYDRYNLEKYRKDFSQWLRDERKRTGQEIKYLLVPEKHVDGAWHMHGLFMGCEKELVKFEPPAPLDLIRGGFLDWPRYRVKFGFCSFGLVRNHEAVAGYISKYVTKAFEGGEERNRCKEVGNHLYYASQGLDRAQLCYRGVLAKPLPGDCFENEYVKIYFMKEFPLDYIDPIAFPFGIIPDTISQNNAIE